MKRTIPRKLGIIALLIAILSMSLASFSASAPPPTLSVDVTTHRTSSGTSPGAGFDSILYVTVPHQRPFVPPFFNLLQSFVLQSIDITETAPDGRATTTTVTCTLSTTPGYPSRDTVSTCSGVFPWRVNSRAYPGSTTGIYWIGFGEFTPGDWTYTYTVTGLYNGATTTLTSSFVVTFV